MCIFLPTLFNNNIETYTVVMKNTINTISKKIHTLLKENTPCCHNYKIGTNVVSLKRLHFSTYHCVFLPAVANIGREVRLMLPNTFGELHAAIKGWLGGNFFRTPVRRVHGA